MSMRGGINRLRLIFFGCSAAYYDPLAATTHFRHRASAKPCYVEVVRGQSSGKESTVKTTFASNIFSRGPTNLQIESDSFSGPAVMRHVKASDRRQPRGFWRTRTAIARGRNSRKTTQSRVLRWDDLTELACAEPSNHIHAQLAPTIHDLTDTTRRTQHRHEVATREVMLVHEIVQQIRQGRH
jgi:hypothetical protein